MMKQGIYHGCIEILETELIPALGCTEPIAIAYASAKAREVLGDFPEKITVSSSGNIVKNVKGVVVPATGGLKGIEAAAIIGAVGGDSSLELEVLSKVTEEHRRRTKELMEEGICTAALLNSTAKLHIVVEMQKGDQTSKVEVIHTHTGIVRIEKNGEVLLDVPHDEEEMEAEVEMDFLNIPAIYEFARNVRIEDVKPILKRQIEYNTTIAEYGLKHTYGANVGAMLIKMYGDNVSALAKAMPAAGSDARMGGCELPVVINSGSGNQGMTVSLPVIVYARELKATEEQLYRALCISNLTAVYQKKEIGRLSAYCGAVSAGAGAGAGIAYLLGGGVEEIGAVVTNTLANVAGIVCDGAKASCAAKIASSVEAALMAINLTFGGRTFSPGEGIVKEDVNDTVEGVAMIAREGMRITDEVILDVMINS
ncbi:serine dehydratase subunit alpha family protein [Diplocloster agilis]|uniref:L-cysteine desulfidase family protein n=1 Tax=Diplocloster agilis TaxID=2850323 RepID=UPI00399C647A